MNAFILTAQLNLRSPTAGNITAVTNQINTALGSGVRPVKIKVQATGQRQLKQLQANLNRIDRNAKEAATGVELFGRQAAYAARRYGAFLSVTTGAFVLFRSIKSALGDAIDFQRELVKIAQIGNTSVLALENVTSQITTLATTLGVASDKLVNINRILRQTGISSKDVATAMETLAKTELAPTFDDIAATTEGAIAIMNQFSHSANDLEADLGAINAVSKRFAVESKDIITGVRKAGAAFRAAGGDLNEFIALFTSVRQTTRESAETIGTGLRTVFTRLQRPRTTRFLKTLGIELRDNVTGEFKGAFAAVQELNRALTGIDPSDVRFSQIVEQLGGFRQVSKVIPLLQEFETAQLALNVAQRGTNSLTQDAAIAQESLAIQITKVKEQFIALFREIGTSEEFHTMVSVVLKLSSALIKLAGAIKPILPLLGLLGTVATAKFIARAVPRFTGTLSGLAEGGLVKELPFSSGGLVPGYGNFDSIRARLTPGEYVLRKSAVENIGVNNLEMLNRSITPKAPETQTMATGGVIEEPEDKTPKPKPKMDKEEFKHLLGLTGTLPSIVAKVLEHRFVEDIFNALPSRIKPIDVNQRAVIFTTPGRNIIRLTDGKEVSGDQKLTEEQKALIEKKATKTKDFGGIQVDYLGKVKKFATGGIVPQRFAFGGNVGTDTVPALLTPGEFVLRKSAVNKLGIDQLDRLNRGEVETFAHGGLVQRFALGGVIPTTPSGIAALLAALAVTTNMFDSVNEKVKNTIGVVGQTAVQFLLLKGIIGAIIANSKEAQQSTKLAATIEQKQERRDTMREQSREANIERRTYRESAITERAAIVPLEQRAQKLHQADPLIRESVARRKTIAQGEIESARSAGDKKAMLAAQKRLVKITQNEVARRQNIARIDAQIQTTHNNIAQADAKVAELANAQARIRQQRVAVSTSLNQDLVTQRRLQRTLGGLRAAGNATLAASLPASLIGNFLTNRAETLFAGAATEGEYDHARRNAEVGNVATTIGTSVGTGAAIGMAFGPLGALAGAAAGLAISFFKLGDAADKAANAMEKAKFDKSIDHLNSLLSGVNSGRVDFSRVSTQIQTDIKAITKTFAGSTKEQYTQLMRQTEGQVPAFNQLLISIAKSSRTLAEFRIKAGDILPFFVSLSGIPLSEFEEQIKKMIEKEDKLAAYTQKEIDAQKEYIAQLHSLSNMTDAVQKAANSLEAFAVTAEAIQGFTNGKIGPSPTPDVNYNNFAQGIRQITSAFGTQGVALERNAVQTEQLIDKLPDILLSVRSNLVGNMGTEEVFLTLEQELKRALNIPQNQSSKLVSQIVSRIEAKSGGAAANTAEFINQVDTNFEKLVEHVVKGVDAPIEALKDAGKLLTKELSHISKLYAQRREIERAIIDQLNKIHDQRLAQEELFAEVRGQPLSLQRVQQLKNQRLEDIYGGPVPSASVLGQELDQAQNRYRKASVGYLKAENNEKNRLLEVMDQEASEIQRITSVLGYMADTSKEVSTVYKLLIKSIKSADEKFNLVKEWAFGDVGQQRELNVAMAATMQAIRDQSLENIPATLHGSVLKILERFEETRDIPMFQGRTGPELARVLVAQQLRTMPLLPGEPGMSEQMIKLLTQAITSSPLKVAFEELVTDLNRQAEAANGTLITNLVTQHDNLGKVIRQEWTAFLHNLDLRLAKATEATLQREKSTEEAGVAQIQTGLDAYKAIAKFFPERSQQADIVKQNATVAYNAAKQAVTQTKAGTPAREEAEKKLKRTETEYYTARAGVTTKDFMDSLRGNLGQVKSYVQLNKVGDAVADLMDENFKKLVVPTSAGRVKGTERVITKEEALAHVQTYLGTQLTEAFGKAGKADLGKNVVAELVESIRKNQGFGKGAGFDEQGDIKIETINTAIIKQANAQFKALLKTVREGKTPIEEGLRLQYEPEEIQRLINNFDQIQEALDAIPRNASAEQLEKKFDNLNATLKETVKNLTQVQSTIRGKTEIELPINLTTITSLPKQILALTKDWFGFKAATGMLVPGMGNRDSVPAMLTPGEVVLNSRQQYRLGQKFGESSGNIFSSIGVPGFAKGGLVGRQKFQGGGAVAPDPELLKLLDIYNKIPKDLWKKLAEVKVQTGRGSRRIEIVLRDLGNPNANTEVVLNALNLMSSEDWAAAAAEADKLNVGHASIDPLLKQLQNIAQQRATESNQPSGNFLSRFIGRLFGQTEEPVATQVEESAEVRAYKMKLAGLSGNQRPEDLPPLQPHKRRFVGTNIIPEYVQFGKYEELETDGFFELGGSSSFTPLPARGKYVKIIAARKKQLAKLQAQWHKYYSTKDEFAGELFTQASDDKKDEGDKAFKLGVVPYSAMTGERLTLVPGAKLPPRKLAEDLSKFANMWHPPKGASEEERNRITVAGSREAQEANEVLQYYNDLQIEARQEAEIRQTRSLLDEDGDYKPYIKARQREIKNIAEQHATPSTRAKKVEEFLSRKKIEKEGPRKATSFDEWRKERAARPKTESRFEKWRKEKLAKAKLTEEAAAVKEEPSVTPVPTTPTAATSKPLNTDAKLSEYLKNRFGDTVDDQFLDSIKLTFPVIPPTAADLDKFSPEWSAFKKSDVQKKREEKQTYEAEVKRSVELSQANVEKELAAFAKMDDLLEKLPQAQRERAMEAFKTKYGEGLGIEVPDTLEDFNPAVHGVGFVRRGEGPNAPYMMTSTLEEQEAAREERRKVLDADAVASKKYWESMGVAVSYNGKPTLRQGTDRDAFNAIVKDAQEKGIRVIDHPNFKDVAFKTEEANQKEYEAKLALIEAEAKERRRIQNLKKTLDQKRRQLLAQRKQGNRIAYSQIPYTVTGRALEGVERGWTSVMGLGGTLVGGVGSLWGSLYEASGAMTDTLGLTQGAEAEGAAQRERSMAFTVAAANDSSAFLPDKYRKLIGHDKEIGAQTRVAEGGFEFLEKIRKPNLAKIAREFYEWGNHIFYAFAGELGVNPLGPKGAALKPKPVPKEPGFLTRERQVGGGQRAAKPAPKFEEAPPPEISPELQATLDELGHPPRNALEEKWVQQQVARRQQEALVAKQERSWPNRLRKSWEGFKEKIAEARADRAARQKAQPPKQVGDGKGGTFHYEAMDNSGLEVSGKIKASSEAEAAQALKDQGWFVTEGKWKPFKAEAPKAKTALTVDEEALSAAKLTKATGRYIARGAGRVWESVRDFSLLGLGKRIGKFFGRKATGAKESVTNTLREYQKGPKSERPDASSALDDIIQSGKFDRALEEGRVFTVEELAESAKPIRQRARASETARKINEARTQVPFEERDFNIYGPNGENLGKFRGRNKSEALNEARKYYATKEGQKKLADMLAKKKAEKAAANAAAKKQAKAAAEKKSGSQVKLKEYYAETPDGKRLPGPTVEAASAKEAQVLMTQKHKVPLQVKQVVEPKAIPKPKTPGTTLEDLATGAAKPKGKRVDLKNTSGGTTSISEEALDLELDKIMSETQAGAHPKDPIWVLEKLREKTRFRDPKTGADSYVEFDELNNFVAERGLLVRKGRFTVADVEKAVAQREAAAASNKTPTTTVDMGKQAADAVRKAPQVGGNTPEAWGAKFAEKKASLAEVEEAAKAANLNKTETEKLVNSFITRKQELRAEAATAGGNWYEPYSGPGNATKIAEENAAQRAGQNKIQSTDAQAVENLRQRYHQAEGRAAQQREKLKEITDPDLRQKAKDKLRRYVEDAETLKKQWKAAQRGESVATQAYGEAEFQALPELTPEEMAAHYPLQELSQAERNAAAIKAAQEGPIAATPDELAELERLMNNLSAAKNLRGRSSASAQKAVAQAQKELQTFLDKIHGERPAQTYSKGPGVAETQPAASVAEPGKPKIAASAEDLKALAAKQNEAEQLLRGGKTLNEIAAQFGVEPRAVKEFFTTWREEQGLDPLIHKNASYKKEIRPLDTPAPDKPETDAARKARMDKVRERIAEEQAAQQTAGTEAGPDAADAAEAAGFSADEIEIAKQNIKAAEEEVSKLQDRVNKKNPISSLQRLAEERLQNAKEVLKLEKQALEELKGGQNFARGGRVMRFAEGGTVPGTGVGDTVPAMLEPGEFIMNRMATRAIGTPLLNRMNKSPETVFPVSDRIKQASDDFLRSMDGVQPVPVLTSSSAVRQTVAAEADQQRRTTLKRIEKSQTEPQEAFSRILNINPDSLSKFESSVVRFGNTANLLAQSMDNFPREISLQASHKIEVIFNGAEILSKLQPEIEEVAVKEAKAAINKMLRKKFPTIGGID